MSPATCAGCAAPVGARLIDLLWALPDANAKTTSKKLKKMLSREVAPLSKLVTSFIPNISKLRVCLIKCVGKIHSEALPFTGAKRRRSYAQKVIKGLEQSALSNDLAMSQHLLCFLCLFTARIRRQFEVKHECKG